MFVCTVCTVCTVCIVSTVYTVCWCVLCVLYGYTVSVVCMLRTDVCSDIHTVCVRSMT